MPTKLLLSFYQKFSLSKDPTKPECEASFEVEMLIENGI